MEHHPHPPEGGEHRNEENETPETQPVPIYEQLTDEQRIQRGIADALNEERPIDDVTARRIAAQLHTGQDSALYALASSGALDERLERELLESVQDLPPERDSWIDALLDYADARSEDRGPREDWAEVTRDEPGQTAVTEEQLAKQVREAAAEQYVRDRKRFKRFVEAGIRPDDAEVLVEFVHFVREQRAEQAEAASEPMDEAEATPGIDQSGEPAQLGNTEQKPDPAEDPISPEHGEQPRPRIYVRCLASYTSGMLHGCWIDAAQDVETLQDEVQTMLNASPVPGAEEHAIHDYEDFLGYSLGEYEDLATVSRIAQGIVEHGQAFAAYAEWIGREDPELTRFGDHFDGTYPSREAWADEIADEVFEWPKYLAAIPEPLRSAVTLNLADLALTLEQHRHVVEGDGGVYVFNPDA